MHPLQRRSLFAILAIAESAIQQMRSILAQGDEAQDIAVPQRTRAVNQPQADYLDEKEEAALAREMEEERLRMIAEDEKRIHGLWENQ
jgi:hypothetical protein